MKHILHATFLLTALLLALCFAFSGPVSAGTANAPALAVALGQGLAQAQTLLDQGKAEEAYALYMRLLHWQLSSQVQILLFAHLTSTIHHHEENSRMR